MDRCPDYSCLYIGSFGYCKLTACIKHFNYTCMTLTSHLDTIIFPQTIGCITFYSSKELIKWVDDQQKINEDPNYGIGNWA